MSINLIYHKDDGNSSPFDACAVEIADDASLNIACPYLSLDYLERLIDLAKEWKLITDVTEWLTSTPTSNRKKATTFIRKHFANIRHHQGLHAKVLIGDKSVMIGSANFTHSGISRRTEMCVQLDNRASVKEMKIWFKSLWENSNEIETKSLSSLIEQLPKTPSIQKPAITPSGSKRDVPLVELEEPPIIPSEPPPNIIYYQNARVHYLNGSSRLRVLKGSLASGNPSKAFFKYQGRTDRLRDYLIEQGILAREKDYGDYTFTTDYDFDAPGPAACIIDGNSRNGRHRDVFGNP